MDKWIEGGQAINHIAVDDRGLQYGDGIFETVAIRNGAPRLWQYHIDRLTRGCKVLGIKMPSDDELFEGLSQALEASHLPMDRACVKIIVSAGSGLRGYAREFANSPSVLFRAFASDPLDRGVYENGIDTVLCKTRLASGSATAGLKTLNRLEQVLARSEFTGTDAFEGLTLDAEDNIICGTMSNVFFVNDRSISTPATDQCGVAGVMRRHVIETLSRDGTSVQVRPFPLSDLDRADAVFLSNSQFGVIPVTRCMDWTWPVGDVTHRVMALLAENAVTEGRL